MYPIGFLLLPLYTSLPYSEGCYITSSLGPPRPAPRPPRCSRMQTSAERPQHNTAPRHRGARKGNGRTLIRRQNKRKDVGGYAMVIWKGRSHQSWQLNEGATQRSRYNSREHDSRRDESPGRGKIWFGNKVIWEGLTLYLQVHVVMCPAQFVLFGVQEWGKNNPLDATRLSCQWRHRRQHRRQPQARDATTEVCSP